MGGGAWPFLVGGVICLVDSDNERDSVLLTSGVAIRAGRRAFIRRRLVTRSFVWVSALAWLTPLSTSALFSTS